MRTFGQKIQGIKTSMISRKLCLCRIRNTFPKDKELRYKWKQLELTGNTVVRSEHFDAKCFYDWKASNGLSRDREKRFARVTPGFLPQKFS